MAQSPPLLCSSASGPDRAFIPISTAFAGCNPIRSFLSECAGGLHALLALGLRWLVGLSFADSAAHAIHTCRPCSNARFGVARGACASEQWISGSMAMSPFFRSIVYGSILTRRCDLELDALLPPPAVGPGSCAGDRSLSRSGDSG